MELRHLRYFTAVAEEEHMTRAAARLGIQQPPLSQQIQGLERELGVELFTRTPRRIRLNAAGQVFLDDVRHILALSESAVARVRQCARGELGRISVGYTSSAAIHERVPYLIRSFHERYPLIDLQVQENTTRGLLDAVQAQQIDAAIVRGSTQRYPDLQVVALGEETMVVAAPIGHPLGADSSPVPLIALAREPFIVYTRSDGPGIVDFLAAACRRAGFEPVIAETVPKLLSALTMVSAGRGVALVPETTRAILGASIRYRPLIAEDGFTIPLNLVHRPTAAGSPLDRFVALVNGAGA